MTTSLQAFPAHRLGAADVGLFILRAALAAVFMYHGSQKLFGWFGGPGLQGAAGFIEKLGIPFPLLSTTVLAVTEFFGGLIVLLGTGARLAAVPMAFAMLVAIVTAHPNAFDSRKGGMEFPLTLGAALVALALIGPGRLPLGGLLGNQSERRKLICT